MDLIMTFLSIVVYIIIGFVVLCLASAVVCAIYFAYRRDYYRWTEAEQIKFIRQSYQPIDNDKNDNSVPPKNWDSSMTDR